MAKPQFIEDGIEKWLTSFKYKTTFRTRFNETDAFGHINNVSFFTYFEQARIDYFETLNLFDHLNISTSMEEQQSDYIIVTANLECHYISQLFYGQNIDTFVRTARIGNSSFDLEYAIVDEKKNLCAAGRGTIVYINRNTNKSELLPESLKEKIDEYEGDSSTTTKF